MIVWAAPVLDKINSSSDYFHHQFFSEKTSIPLSRIAEIVVGAAAGLVTVLTVPVMLGAVGFNAAEIAAASLAPYFQGKLQILN